MRTWANATCLQMQNYGYFRLLGTVGNAAFEKIALELL